MCSRRLQYGLRAGHQRAGADDVPCLQCRPERPFGRLTAHAGHRHFVQRTHGCYQMAHHLFVDVVTTLEMGEGQSC